MTARNNHTPNYYTYLWLREDGTPYYVGKGTRRRAFVKHQRFSPPSDRVRIVIQDFDNEESALKAEVFLVSFYGREDINTGTLLNMTDGGDAPPSFKGKKRGPFSLEHRAKLSAAKKGKPGIRTGKKRPPLSPEHKAKLAAANHRRIYRRGWHHSEESKAYLSVLNKGKTLSAEHREKIRIKALARGISPETLVKMADTRRANFRKRCEHGTTF